MARKRFQDRNGISRSSQTDVPDNERPCRPCRPFHQLLLPDVKPDSLFLRYLGRDEKLARRYRSARVLEFAGPTGEWLRIRVAEDDRGRAETVARETQTPEGSVFLVRLD